MSAPASACTSDLAHQRLERLVVGDLGAAHQAVVSVVRVGIERDVKHDADVEAGVFDGARRPADEIVRIERLARVFGAQLRLGVGKERDGRDAELQPPARRLRRFVDGEPLDAGHGGDRHALLLALDDEQRPDQVVDAEADARRRGAATTACDGVGASERAESLMRPRQHGLRTTVADEGRRVGIELGVQGRLD